MFDSSLKMRALSARYVKILFLIERCTHIRIIKKESPWLGLLEYEANEE